MTTRHLQHRQRGITLTGLFLVLFVAILVALLAMKLIPPYIEYSTAKGAIEAIARERGSATAPEIRRAFEARATIDDISAIKPTDLDIRKDAGGVTIGFAYRKEVPLFANFGVYIDFAAESDGQ